MTFTHPHKQGPLPHTCTKCRPKKHRAQQAKAAARAGDAESARELGGSSGSTPEAALPARMAVGLSVYDHPQLAAEVVGIKGTPKDLERLAAVARKHHADVIELEANAVKQMGFRLVMLLFQKLWDSTAAGELTPNLYGSTLKQVVGALEGMETAGAKLIPTKTSVVWRRPE